ncbi:MAG: type II secretion system F family protein [Hyphomicrobium sp.]|uniref:type II secretion system F family protein n=1 Tax=Hyphomicrobium sp. CS1BSMeth3 TaxID=1892844 RepID=UPI000930C6A4|nr:type II secretion system F family protein [Hyphomicrobium sp. CS1BSMeth3]MBN9259437.1 type II secretion system F family protein [Hyphomicrobium sp.]MBN9264048.1 type II secretion system F family protein [Hyphomicrobium sp.]
MLDPEVMQLGLVGLAALSAAAIIYILAYPLLSGSTRTEKRIQGVTENKTKRAVRNAQAEQISNRRRQVADTLKELEQKQKQREKLTMRKRLERAGLDVTPRVFWLASIVAGAAFGTITFVSLPGMTPLISLAVAFVGVFGLPRWVVNRMIKRRQSKFLDEFANSIDVIVRGVKSGLPLNECLNIIARESPSPIKEEFKELVEQQRVGVPLSECFERMMDRMPLPEVNFFAIVISIQQQAGGNLSEALGNLSGVLRDRKRMQAKVKALSAEAKASAGVLAALPFAVMLMVYFSTPNYIKILFTAKMGQFLLLCAAIWMTCGVLVMKKMINFKY